MSVISSIAIQVTREHPKSYAGTSRVQATNTRVALSKRFQDLIEPVRDLSSVAIWVPCYFVACGLTADGSSEAALAVKIR